MNSVMLIQPNQTAPFRSVSEAVRAKQNADDRHTVLISQSTLKLFLFGNEKMI